MEAERWGEVKRVFNAALDLPESERARYIDDACAGDASLLHEVESLLSSYREAAGLMEAPAQLPDQSETLAQDDRWLSRKIGPYQPVAKLGEGGMGVVYRAVRVDDHYVKQLAIKVLREGRVEPRQLRRFQIERQILASLDHPNIARLLDAGSTEDGHPYFVMEFVEGVRIDDYCDERKLNIEQRLRLFQEVCKAVQYAHQKLVVHRDLKPANILVTNDGHPKLLDFGIAKLLDPELFFQTAELTATHVRAMTPDYASPEQARGDAVTTASDVYSLGVVLYRLLTGHPPYQVTKRNPAQMVRIICEQEPEKPSVIVNRTEVVVGNDGHQLTLNAQSVSLPREGQPALLRKRLAGDLDNILLKSLAKDPARRYGSAEQFSADINRYLEGLPVVARSDTFWYRSEKYLRRNWLPIGAAVLVLLSLTGGIWATARQARIARAAQQRAERRFEEARKIAHDMIYDVHDSIQYLPGATSARELIVRDALSYLDNLTRDAAGDASLQRELAMAYEKIGDVQAESARSNLGNTSEGLNNYRKAQVILENLLESNPGDRKLRKDLAGLHTRFARIFSETGNFPESLKAAQKNLELTLQLAQSADPSDKDSQMSLAISYDGLSDTQIQNGSIDAGLESTQKSLSIFEDLLAKHPDNRIYRRDVALEHKKKGGILEFTGKLDAALVEYRTALPVDEMLSKEEPNDTLARRDLSVSYSSIGDVLLKKGDAAGALALYQKAAAIDDAIAAHDPKDAWALASQGYDYKRIGDALLKRGEIAKARAAYERATSFAERRASLDATNAYAQADLAEAYSRMADAFSAAGAEGRLPGASRREVLLAARSYYEKSLEVWRQLQMKGAIPAALSSAPNTVSESLAKCRRTLESIGVSRS